MANVPGAASNVAGAAGTVGFTAGGFVPVFGAVAGALGTFLSVNAQNNYAKALKKASAEELPAIYKQQLAAITATSQKSQAEFDAALADQQRVTKTILIGGGALLIFYVLIR
jgi:hypothetical protein